MVSDDQNQTRTRIEAFGSAPGWLIDAHDLAKRAHDGQKDKAGNRYFDHPARVAAAVSTHGYDFEGAAYLHDTVEDTHITLDTLRAIRIPEDVVRAVDALTRRDGEPPEDYYQRVAVNLIARVVKRADIADNSDPQRLALLDEATQNRLRAKYTKALRLLDTHTQDQP